MKRDVLEDLSDEQDRLESLLEGLSEREWGQPSACSGWSVADVVLHLAQTEEAVVATLDGSGFEPPAVEGGNVDELMDNWVAAQRGEPGEAVLERWHKARCGALDAFRRTDPSTLVAWVAMPLKPLSLATTRLSEHWLHALDIADPLGRELPDTGRLWQVARLAHRTLPFAYRREGRDDAPSVRLELMAPSGRDTWVFGDEGSEVLIRGDAGEVCRIAGRRLDPDEAHSVSTEGERADEVLRLIRTYA